MTAPVIMQGMSEKIAMTSPVQMQADSTSEEGNGTSDSTYKYDHSMSSQLVTGLLTHRFESNTRLDVQDLIRDAFTVYS